MEKELNEIAERIHECFGKTGEESGSDTVNIVDALCSVSYALKQLGGGQNVDERGAVEFLAISVREGCEEIAGAINDLAEAVLANAPK